MTSTAALMARAAARRQAAADTHVQLARDLAAGTVPRLVGHYLQPAERNITEHVHDMTWAASVGMEWPDNVGPLA